MPLIFRILGVVLFGGLVFFLGAERAARRAHCPDCPSPVGAIAGDKGAGEPSPNENRADESASPAQMSMATAILEVPAPPNMDRLFPEAAAADAAEGAHKESASEPRLVAPVAARRIAPALTLTLASDGAVEDQLNFPFRKISDEDIVRPSEPVYPAACLDKASVNEVVVVRFEIDARGRALSPAAAAATNPCFIEAAIGATQRTRFASRRGDPSTPFIASYFFRKPNDAQRFR